MSVKCFDVAEMVINEANERFAPLWKVNDEDLDVFREYCEAVDTLAEEFDGESYEVEVDELNMNITVALECDEIEITSPDHVFYDLLERAVAVAMSASGPDTMKVKFTFPSLWERA